MDRPEPGLIRWSPSAAHDSFLHINLQHRVVRVYEPTGHAQRNRFEYKKLSQHDDFPPLTTYDWSPSVRGLVAVGTSNGIVNLLRVDDNSNSYLELPLKMARQCQSVAFSTEGLLAVGLDRVRSDQCLYVWDVNRLSALDTLASGFPSASFADPFVRLEPSVSISSIRFFEDNPKTLVVGIRAQGLRIHDLRDPNVVVNFQTKFNNNLAIDYADQNYFASSPLDHPGITVWDRRAFSRPLASPGYLDAVDQDDVPWGGALRLDRAMQTESDPAMSDSKSSFIRSLRYCRNHPGLLAVLSRTGQLKVFSTKHEYVRPALRSEESPELLEVRRSYEMDPLQGEGQGPGRKIDRIVSFDWVTLSSPVLRPRVLVLRASGAFEILEKPSFTSDYLFKMVPWQTPFRGLEEGTSYHAPMEFEPSQATAILGPLFVEEALSDVALFGPDKVNVAAITQKALNQTNLEIGLAEDGSTTRDALPKEFANASSIADKLRAVRLYIQGASEDADSPETAGKPNDSSDGSKVGQAGDPSTHRDGHEKLLRSTMASQGLPDEVQVVIDHAILLRAKEKYLFDFATNQRVVSDDPWLRDVWAWVADAEEATEDGGMISHPLDLSYMGAYAVWTNDLGSKAAARVADGAHAPDINGWERCLYNICKKRGVAKFDGVDTKRPHHRQLCLDICSWGRVRDVDGGGSDRGNDPTKASSWHTRAAARALFRGDSREAVQILKKASTAHPELLFVSLALQLIGKADSEITSEQLDFDERVASKTDPYLRAISSLIATGDWATIANQKSLPLRDRAFVAVRNFSDDQLTSWFENELAQAVAAGDIEGIVLTGITDKLVDILCRYVQKFQDYQTATLILSVCAPRYMDDMRCTALRNAYRAYLQRHRAFFQRCKFEVESTKRSKHDGRPTIRPPGRQIALRCVFCDAETTLAATHNHSFSVQQGASGRISPLPGPSARAAGPEPQPNPFTEKMVGAGVSCPTCKRHLPRCVVCLEVVGMQRSDPSGGSVSGGRAEQQQTAVEDAQARLAARFPTFCLKCEHVLHLEHARQWFARHQECPVPECRCKCNFRANPELSYR